MLADYKSIRCPKCGKSYFKVKHHNTNLYYDIVPAIFNFEPDLIYKDGVLQNPQPEIPSKTYFKCLECHCNFRVESYSDHYDIFDEDDEKIKREAEYKKQREGQEAKRKAESEKKKQETINSALTIGSNIDCTTATISVKDAWRIVKDISNASDIVYKDKPLNELIENILNRLDKLERKD